MSHTAPRVRRAAFALAVICCAAGTPAAHAQQSAQSGDIVMQFWPAQQRLATALLSTASLHRFPGLPADILARGQPIYVHVAPDEARFDSLTFGRAPEWGAGVAFPDRGVIVVPGYVSERTGTHELRSVLRHELAHVALQRHLGTARVPRWFTEGYATWVADEFDRDAGWMLRIALATGAAPPLDSLTLDWPAGEVDARLAYLLSASAVSYLHSLGNAGTFERFLEQWRTSGSIETALRGTYIVTSAQLEALWQAHVKRRYGWLQIVVQSLFAWAVLAVLVVLLFFLRRRRNRLRLERLLATELPDEPAFWREDPEGGDGRITEGDVRPENEDPRA